MPGTRKGGIKAAATNKQRYGKDFYIIVGKAGGEAGTGKKGFAVNPELAAAAGRKGGLASRRPKRKELIMYEVYEEKHDEIRNTETTLWSRLLRKARG